MSKKRLEEGDIFYIREKGKYFFGKILLDVNERILKQEPKNALWTFSGCYMVSVYRGIYDELKLTTNELVIPSAFITKKYFYSKKHKIEWSYYKHEPIEYKELEFPESLINGEGMITYFTKGELKLKTDLTYQQFDKEYCILKTNHRSYYSLIDIACHYQNREDLMDIKRAFYLERSDLRFAPEKRKEVYKQIGEDINQSYYEMALKHGLDFGRFYK